MIHHIHDCLIISFAYQGSIATIITPMYTDFVSVKILVSVTVEILTRSPVRQCSLLVIEPNL